MKKQPLAQKTPRPLSPVERVPGETLREIFSYLDLKELTRITTVSKFWDEQISQDPRWHELYLKECNELNRLSNEKILPRIARKKYGDYKRMVKKLSSMKKIDPLKLFKSVTYPTRVVAARLNDLMLIHVLLKNKFLDVNATFDIHPTTVFDYLTNSIGTNLNMTLVYYAAIHERLDIVKLLLLHGADVTKKITRK